MSIHGSAPLYSRVPSRDKDGGLLSDFMGLISGLRDRPGLQRIEIIAKMHAVLNSFSEVVFADLNLELNLLWVSVKPRYGVIAEISAELQHHVPEAKLVGSYSG